MYEIGDYFLHTSWDGSSNVYILANTGFTSGARLICLKTGNRWYDSRITDAFTVSAEQFHDISNRQPDAFTKITFQEALKYLKDDVLAADWEV